MADAKLTIDVEINNTKALASVAELDAAIQAVNARFDTLKLEWKRATPSAWWGETGTTDPTAPKPKKQAARRG